MDPSSMLQSLRDHHFGNSVSLPFLASQDGQKFDSKAIRSVLYAQCGGTLRTGILTVLSSYRSIWLVSMRWVRIFGVGFQKPSRTLGPESAHVAESRV